MNGPSSDVRRLPSVEVNSSFSKNVETPPQLEHVYSDRISVRCRSNGETPRRQSSQWNRVETIDEQLQLDLGTVPSKITTPPRLRSQAGFRSDSAPRIAGRPFPSARGVFNQRSTSPLTVRNACSRQPQCFLVEH